MNSKWVKFVFADFARKKKSLKILNLKMLWYFSLAGPSNQRPQPSKSNRNANVSQSDYPTDAELAEMNEMEIGKYSGRDCGKSERERERQGICSIFFLLFYLQVPGINHQHQPIQPMKNWLKCNMVIYFQIDLKF